MYEDEEHKELNIQGLGNRIKATITEIHANPEIKNKVAFMFYDVEHLENQKLLKCKKKKKILSNII